MHATKECTTTTTNDFVNVRTTRYVLYTVEGIYCYSPGRSSTQTTATAIADITKTTTIATTCSAGTTIHTAVGQALLTEAACTPCHGLLLIFILLHNHYILDYLLI